MDFDPSLPCISIVDDRRMTLCSKIALHIKTVETRPRNVFKGIVGQKVNMLGKLPNRELVFFGTAVIGEPVRYSSADDFDSDFVRHQIGIQDPWHKESGCGYPLLHVRWSRLQKVCGRRVGNRSYFKLIQED